MYGMPENLRYGGQVQQHPMPIQMGYPGNYSPSPIHQTQGGHGKMMFEQNLLASHSPSPTNQVLNMGMRMPMNDYELGQMQAQMNEMTMQQQQQMMESTAEKATLYKTELCKKWQTTGTCRYGAKCQFAHGPHELRTLIRHPLYKTTLCKSFQATGSCRYGSRCRFIHDESVFQLANVPRMQVGAASALAASGALNHSKLVPEPMLAGQPQHRNSPLAANATEFIPQNQMMQEQHPHQVRFSGPEGINIHDNINVNGEMSMGNEEIFLGQRASARASVVKSGNKPFPSAPAGLNLLSDEADIQAHLNGVDDRFDLQPGVSQQSQRHIGNYGQSEAEFRANMNLKATLSRELNVSSNALNELNHQEDAGSGTGIPRVSSLAMLRQQALMKRNLTYHGLKTLNHSSNVNLDENSRRNESGMNLDLQHNRNQILMGQQQQGNMQLNASLHVPSSKSPSPEFMNGLSGQAANDLLLGRHGLNAANFKLGSQYKNLSHSSSALGAGIPRNWSFQDSNDLKKMPTGPISAKDLPVAPSSFPPTASYKSAQSPDLGEPEYERGMSPLRAFGGLNISSNPNVLKNGYIPSTSNNGREIKSFHNLPRVSTGTEVNDLTLQAQQQRAFERAHSGGQNKNIGAPPSLLVQAQNSNFNNRFGSGKNLGLEFYRQVSDPELSDLN